MYGLVNKAVEDLVCTRFGAETWAKIQAKADVGVEGFVSMDPYPDAVTYKLVIAASEVLGESVPALLEAFGEFWILYTAREGYGELVTMFGSSMREFLGNLDNMHTRLGMSFPQLRPPSFVARDLDDGTIELEYHSTREALAPMVVGLLKGLGKSFGEAVEVEHMQRREDAGFDVFRVKIGAPGAG